MIEEGRGAHPKAALRDIDLLLGTAGLPESRRSEAEGLKLTLEQAMAEASAARLPRPLTSFVGREEEKAKIKALLKTQRLVTLTGMGGCGKTRLALAVAAEVQDAGGGDVRLVELASLTDPALVPQTVTKALGLEVRENFVDALIAYFQHKPTLLLLDNCEHLVQACADLVETLLQACPELNVLATSREPLKIDGEHLCPVLPLGIPDPNHLPPDSPDPVAALLQHDSVRLFLDRIRPHGDIRLGPENIPAVAVICASLDGIPLALELAAARVKLLPLPAIAEMLTDRFGLLTDGRRTALPRHKTLRAVLDWSYDLLTGPEQALLCRLSVFAGGWTLDAAEAVGLAEGVTAHPVLDLLTSLVDKSLVTTDVAAAPGRYGMLETVRQYAQDRLREMGEWDETCRKHRDFYLQLAEEAEPQLRGPEQKQWLDRLEREHDNFRAALAWRADETALRLACALTRFWWVRGYFEEGQNWLKRGIDERESVSEEIQARTLISIGRFAYVQGKLTEAQKLYEQGLALHTKLGNKRRIADALFSLGGVADHQGQYQQAIERFQGSLTLYQELSDERGIADALYGLGIVAQNQDHYLAAKRYQQESLAFRRKLGDIVGIASSLNSLATVAFYQGYYEEAQTFFDESLALRQVLENKGGIAHSLSFLGQLARARGDYQEARTMLLQSLHLYEIIGNRSGIFDALNSLACVAYDEGKFDESENLLRQIFPIVESQGNESGMAILLSNLGGVARGKGQFSEAHTLFKTSLKSFQLRDEKSCITNSLEELAFLARAEGATTRAALLWGAEKALSASIGSCRPPNEHSRKSLAVSEVQKELGEEAFAAAWAEGQAMTWEQAVAFALEEPAP